jgi:hypothetical protein
MELVRIGQSFGCLVTPSDLLAASIVSMLIK